MEAIGSVDRALDVLMLFGRSLQTSLGVTEIATQLGMPKSGVHRVLSTLRRRHLVSYDPASRKYSLGQASLGLAQGYAARQDMTAMAMQVLTELMQATGETATLVVRRHATAVHRAQVVAEHELRMEVLLARPFPLHAGASGKAFLAFIPVDESADYVRRATSATGHLAAVTDSTIVDPVLLERDMERSRSRGFTVSHGERLTGVSAVSVPVVDYDRYPVSVLTVIGPSARVRPRLTTLAATAQAAADEVSRRMG